MSGFRAPGADEYNGQGFAIAAEDSYRCLIDSYEIRENEVTQYNKEGNPRVRFFLTPLSIADDPEAPLLDTNGNELPEDKQFMFFFDPDHLGTAPRLAKSRKFLANALQIDYEQPVDAETLEAFCDSLLNREIICDVIVKTQTKNGQERQFNNIVDTRRVKLRAKRERVEKPSLVEAVAAETFAADTFADDGGRAEDY